MDRPIICDSRKCPTKIGGVLYDVQFSDGSIDTVWVDEIASLNTVIDIAIKRYNDKNKRNVIQIAVTETQGFPETTLVALCNDGSIWKINICTKEHEWIRILDIPQGE